MKNGECTFMFAGEVDNFRVADHSEKTVSNPRWTVAQFESMTGSQTCWCSFH